jgi:hypothetical protein
MRGVTFGHPAAKYAALAAWSELWHGALLTHDRRLHLVDGFRGRHHQMENFVTESSDENTRGAGGRALLRERKRAGLPVQADPLHRAVPAGRQLGPDRAAQIARAWPRRWASRSWSRTAPVPAA